jgi:UPF0755 protein
MGGPIHRIGLVQRIGLALALLAAGVAAALIWATIEYYGDGPNVADKNVVLPRGAALEAIAETLAREGILRHPRLFVVTVELSGAGRRVRAGEYRFPAAVSARDVVDILLSGKMVVRRLTVPEGLTVAEVVQLLLQAEGLTGDLPALPAEGRLLPETYHYVWGDDRAQLLERMARARDEVLAELWTGRAAGLPYRDVDEAVVMASIVEKETAKAEERSLIAGVFINRLRRGMRLQSDPTVIYGLTGGRGALGRPIVRADWEHASAWNTYRIDGLPPTPIGNPGRASLAAALRPEPSRYIYFVADGAGGHAFAESLDEHNQNVRARRK